MKNIIPIVALLVFIISGCKKKEDSPTVGGSNVIQVTVQSEAGTAIAGAEVAVGSIKGTSDGSGKVTLSGVSVNDGKYNIKVVKDGYFEGYKNILRISETTAHNTTIKLIQKQVLGTVDANTANTLTGSQFDMILSGNGFDDGNGNNASGNITVYARYIPASDLQLLADLMPGGDFAAIGQGGTEGILESYGFTATEFRDAGGKQVFPKNGAAEMAVQLSANAVTQVSNSGSDMWYYNNSTNAWSYGGALALQGNKVRMKVTASTFGNCDKIRTRAYFKAKFYCTNANNPKSNKPFSLTGNAGYAMIYSSVSDEKGQVSVEVGIPSTGGSYTLSIDGYTQSVQFTAGQTTDIGAIDVCNIPAIDDTTMCMIFEGVKYSEYLPEYFHFTNTGSGNSCYYFIGDTTWTLGFIQLKSQFGKTIDISDLAFFTNHNGSYTNILLTDTTTSFCLLPGNSAFIYFNVYDNESQSSWDFKVKENQNIKFYVHGNQKVYQLRNTLCSWEKEDINTNITRGTSIISANFVAK